MRIGPIDINFKGKQPAPQKVELGGTGTLFFSHRLVEQDYNPDLWGDKAITVYDKMRKSDGQVKAALLACELPLHAAHWDIEAASDDTQDQEIAQFLRDNLFDQMTITWEDFLNHMLLMFPFGFSVFEKVWELVDGKYRWRKFAPRLPKSISEWVLDDEGGLVGVKQWISRGGGFVQVEIPVEKLLVFTNAREGSNYAGVSLLRSAYKHWYYKDQLYRLDGIAAERHGVGIAVFNLPATATTEGEDSDLAKISKIGQSLHAHERSYVALPEGYSFDLKGVTGQLHDIIRSIEHHDMQIVRSILAQFINLGSSEVGSYALSQDQSGFFLMALRAVGKNVCDTINRYAIPQLVDYNWDVQKYPRLVISGLEHREMGTYCKALSDIVNAGLLTPDKGIESELRRFLHLPAIQELKQQQVSGEFTETGYPHQPRGPEVYLAFTEISKTLDSAEEEFIRAAKAVQDKQIGKITDIAAKALDEGDLDKISNISVPFQEEMAGAISGVLTNLYDYGISSVKSEIAKQKKGVKAQDPITEAGTGAVKDFIKARARSIANVLGSKLRASLVWETLHQVREGAADKLGLAQILTSLSDRELISTAKFSVSESYNLGRNVEAKAESDDIDHVVYSALLDKNTCGPCSKVDGQEYDFPSDEWDQVNPPYRECEGQDRCRCIGVYVYKGETPAVQ